MSAVSAPPTTPVPRQLGTDSVANVRPPHGGPERGRTHIADRVVAAVVRQAVRECPETRPLSGRLGGLVDGGAARVSVRRAGAHVTLRLEIAVGYPAPLGAAARRVRAHVRHQVERFTGLTVRHVDIDIVELVAVGRVR